MATGHSLQDSGDAHVIEYKTTTQSRLVGKTDGMSSAARVFSSSLFDSTDCLQSTVSKRATVQERS